MYIELCLKVLILWKTTCFLPSKDANIPLCKQHIHHKSSFCLTFLFPFIWLHASCRCVKVSFIYLMFRGLCVRKCLDWCPCINNALNWSMNYSCWIINRCDHFSYGNFCGVSMQVVRSQLSDLYVRLFYFSWTICRQVLISVIITHISAPYW